MKLIGSNTSPYARRIRMWAATKQIELSYHHIDIFSPEGHNELVQYNPARKIPFLLDDTQLVCDSNLIIRYLREKYQLPVPSWDQENWLILINACSDSLIELLLSKRSGFDIEQDKLFFNLQRERIGHTLHALNEACTSDTFLHCDYLQISLYCLLDWVLFRELIDLSDYDNLVAFHDRLQHQPIAQKTDPRN
ncbi:glutathione S-transferase family protein [Pseudoalteromonas sp. McH1-7]|uniref:glutathione S-transferase family protein n=1 Tax=Pseudoalteromonas TaxID=53246 RepID=UPI00158FCA8C|nr:MULTISPECIES: glutathione S-transferase family protein [Pseudoalteromonas]MDW7549498.1 glutathione S-transferase family protein [Pseudoalteromonas peptidolytica]NUZ10605.1 glutathione S-transferase family protein [Pseudoalteromonas sp. McH1-7]USD29142.1 glutathione S-transferase family protein [Pseudoalteromonas sp. SCSIO 43201]